MNQPTSQNTPKIVRCLKCNHRAGGASTRCPICGSLVNLHEIQANVYYLQYQQYMVESNWLALKSKNVIWLGQLTWDTLEKWPAPQCSTKRNFGSAVLCRPQLYLLIAFNDVHMHGTGIDGIIKCKRADDILMIHNSAVDLWLDLSWKPLYNTV